MRSRRSANTEWGSAKYTKRFCRGEARPYDKRTPPLLHATHIYVHQGEVIAARKRNSPGEAPTWRTSVLAIQDLSAWRRFRKPANPKRPPGRPRKNPGINQFYGLPVEVIAEWCAVSWSTAHGYKTGRLKPSRPAQKLFLLHRDRMVLTRQWNGWLVTPTAIVDPDGNETSRGQLRNYHFMIQYCRELIRRSDRPDDYEAWRRFLSAA